MDKEIDRVAREQIGQKIKDMRNQPRGAQFAGKKVIGTHLGVAIGQSQGSIGNYENGHRLPALDVFKKICDHLGYTPAEILPTNPEIRESLYQQWKINGIEGFFENTVDLYSEKNLNFTSDVRRVEVIYSAELVPGQFVSGKLIKSLQKTISVTLQEFSPTAFALVYTGSAMGEMLEHQQPIILDERQPSPGDLCMLRKNDGFMFTVFESQSPFGMVFRLKGTQSKFTAPPDKSCTVYKVLSLRNASDIE